MLSLSSFLTDFSVGSASAVWVPVLLSWSDLDVSKVEMLFSLLLNFEFSAAFGSAVYWSLVVSLLSTGNFPAVLCSVYSIRLWWSSLSVNSRHGSALTTVAAFLIPFYWQPWNFLLIILLLVDCEICGFFSITLWCIDWFLESLTVILFFFLLEVRQNMSDIFARSLFSTFVPSVPVLISLSFGFFFSGAAAYGVIFTSFGLITTLTGEKSLSVD